MVKKELMNKQRMLQEEKRIEERKRLSELEKQEKFFENANSTQTLQRKEYVEPEDADVESFDEDGVKYSSISNPSDAPSDEILLFFLVYIYFVYYDY